jgi:tetratricopeptide (TPR) repeat protein
VKIASQIRPSPGAFRPFPLPLGEGGAKGRVRVAGVAALLICVLLGCAKTVPVIPPPPPQSSELPEFNRGLSSLHEFTPEGYTRAIQHFQAASNLAPDNCQYRMYLAQANLFLALEQKANSENFRPAWERGTDPQCAPGSAFSLRLQAFRALDDFGPGIDRMSLDKINQAIQLEPDEPLNWFVRWRLNPSTNRQENGILKAAELAPNLALIQYELGNYRLLEGDYDQAHEAFARTLRLSPRHFRSLIGLAQADSAMDEESEVEHLYQEAVELSPTFVEGRILLGDYYFGLDETEKAGEQYLAALAANPNYEVGYLRLGLNYLQTMQLDDAEKAFRKAIEINNSSYEAYYYLGNVWFARGNLPAARQQYEEALKFVLNFPDAVYALGTVFFRQGEIDNALQQFEKVLRSNRAHADAYFSRGAIRALREQFDDAIDDYDRALGLYDNQLALIAQSIDQYEGRGLMRKADAERRRKERVEGIVTRAMQLRAKAEEDRVKP